MERFQAEFRAQVQGDTLTGYASVFGAIAKLPRHYERIGETAFDEVLKRDNVRALVNHNPTYLLATSKAGTLKLGTDSTGLHIEIPKLPDTTYARDLREVIERGDLEGMSFGFIPDKSDWSRAPNGSQLRTHTSLKMLLDVSPVTYPAYEETSVALRAMEWETETGKSQLTRVRARVLTKDK